MKQRNGDNARSVQQFLLRGERLRQAQREQANLERIQE